MTSEYTTETRFECQNTLSFDGGQIRAYVHESQATNCGKELVTAGCTFEWYPTTDNAGQILDGIDVTKLLNKTLPEALLLF